MLSNTLRVNFCYLKVIRILHSRYHSKIIGHILKNDHVCSNAPVSAQVNTSQHESTSFKANQRESNTNQHQSDTSQHESPRVLHESPRVLHESETSLDHKKSRIDMAKQNPNVT